MPPCTRGETAARGEPLGGLVFHEVEVLDFLVSENFESLALRQAYHSQTRGKTNQWVQTAKT